MVITNFMQKEKSENNLEKQTFNMNLLNEKYHCIYATNNVITPPFGMGEGFLNKVIITLTCG